MCSLSFNLKPSTLPTFSMPNGRLFQLEIVAGKKEYLYESQFAWRCLNLRMNADNKLVAAYFILFATSLFINKYVLSVLNFTYPTIFQGWQTLVGFLVLRLFRQNPLVDVNIQDVSFAAVSKWLPAMVLYVVSIYSGSIALSNLPIPVFLSMHNLTLVIYATMEIAFNRKMVSFSRYPLLMLIVISSIATGWTDPMYHEESYFWLAVYIISVGLFSIYENTTLKAIPLNDKQKLYCCYIYSVIMLAPSSYFLGDALSARNFQFFNLYRFYCLCIMSGIAGVFLALCTISLRHRLSEHCVQLNFDQVIGLAKIISCTISLLLFTYKYTAVHLFWVGTNLISALLSSYTQNHSRQTTESINRHGTPPSNDAGHSVSLTTRIPATEHSAVYPRHTSPKLTDEEKSRFVFVDGERGDGLGTVINT